MLILSLGISGTSAKLYERDRFSSFAYYCLSVLEGKVSVHRLVKSMDRMLGSKMVLTDKLL
jgi:hypothetical protein